MNNRIRCVVIARSLRNVHQPNRGSFLRWLKEDTALKKSRKKVCTTTMEVVLLTLKAAEKKRAADA